MKKDAQLLHILTQKAKKQQKKQQIPVNKQSFKMSKPLLLQAACLKYRG